jgi:uncharacterized protein (TIGR03067 family)
MTPTLLAGVLLLAAGAPGLKEKAAPESTLVGEWAVESVTVRGRPVHAGSDRWVFRADGTWALYGRGQELAAGPLTIDPKAAPATIDLAERAAAGRTDLGRYRVDGDTLTLALGHDWGVRPATVEPGPKVTVWVLKRVKTR